MNLVYVDEFVTIIETGNYQRASEKLFIAQPVLSKHIQTLEKNLGFELFYRKYHQLELTEKGEEFYLHAKVLSDEYRKMLMKTTVNSTDRAQKIVIACSSNSTTQLLPHFALRFMKVFPECSVRIMQTETIDTENILKNGIADLAIVISGETAIQIEGYKTDILSECGRIKVFLPFSHKLASSSSVRLEQLVNESFVTLPPNAFTTVMREKLLSQKGLKFNIDHTVRKKDTALNFVKNGLAIFLGMVDLNNESDNEPGVVSIRLEPDVKIFLQLIYSDGNLSVEEKWIIDHLKKI